MPKNKLIRIKLTDFIKTKLESDVVTILKEIQSYSKIIIILWYKEKEINSIQLKEFKSEYSEFVSKGNILFQNHNGNRDFIWYDVQNINEDYRCDNNKFTTTYCNNLEILYRLKEVSNFIKFSNKSKNK